MDRSVISRTPPNADSLGRRECGDRYGPVFVHSPEAVLVSHLVTGHIAAANPAACALFRMTEAELCRAGRGGLVDASDARLPALVAACARERRARGEARLVRKGATTFLAELNVVALPDDTTFVFVRDITARKQAEAALAEAEARYHRFFTGNAAGTFQGRLDLHTGALWRVDCNRRHAEILGYSSVSEVLAEPLAVSFPSDRAYRACVERLVRAGAVTDHEVQLRRKDGTPIWVAVSATLTREADGKTAFTEGSLIDITARKRAEGALRESEQRLRFHVENSPLAVVEWDAGFVVIRWAGAAERMFGWGPAETVGKKIVDLNLIYDSDLPIVEGVMARLADGVTRQVTSSNRNVTKDGRLLYCTWYNSVLLDPDGRMASVLSLVLDDTARVEAEARGRESEVQFRLLAENMAQLAWIMDGTGSIVWYNQRWFDYTGGTFEEMAGWGWRGVHHPDHVERVVEKLRACLASGEVWEDTFPLRRRDGEYRWFLSRAIPIRDARGRITRWFGTNTDVTDQRAIETQLRTVLAEKESALATNQTLVREVHHRTKNNLQMLCDLLYLQATALSSEEAKTVLEEAYGRIFAIARLHEQLYESIERGEIRLAEYLDRLVEGCRSVYPHVQLVLDAPDGGLALDVDRAIHLGLIVNELMLNAIKHAFPPGEGGEVRVRVRPVEEQVELHVRDNGKGLPPDLDVEQAKSLGLRIVQILTTRLAGTLRSTNDGGAAFTIVFPR